MSTSRERARLEEHVLLEFLRDEGPTQYAPESSFYPAAIRLVRNGWAKRLSESRRWLDIEITQAGLAELKRREG